MSAVFGQLPEHGAGGINRAYKQGDRKVTDWFAIADALKANPGHWALVLEGVQGCRAQRISNGLLLAFKPAGSFEAVSRRVEPGSYAAGKDKNHACNIWARFVGDIENESLTSTDGLEVSA